MAVVVGILNKNLAKQLRNCLTSLGIIHMRGVLAIPPFSHATLVLFYKIEEKLENYYLFNLLGSQLYSYPRIWEKVVEKTEKKLG